MTDTYVMPTEEEFLKEHFDIADKKKEPPKESKKKAKEPEERKYLIADFKGLCDLVSVDGEIKFLLDNGEIIGQKIIDEKTYLPPSENDLDFLVPQADKVLIEASKHKHLDSTDHGDDQQGCLYCLELYEEVKNYHITISDMPEEEYFDLLALWDFHTYLIEKFSFSPILYFFADRERGKTRTAKGLIYIARRGVMTETMRESNLIRWGKDHRATMLFDVKNFPKKLEAAQAEDLIYGRAEKGVVASRVLFPEKGAFRDTVRFEVFGPTVVTSNRMIDDIGLSRTICLEMKPSMKVFTTEPSKEMALPLKEKLLGMRLAHFTYDFNHSHKQGTGRLEDMLIGYLRMIRTLFPSKEVNYDKLKKLIKNQKKESSLDSFESSIMQIIINSEVLVEGGTAMLTYEAICAQYNEGKRDNLHIDSRGMGRITKGMGFISKRNAARTKRGIFYDVDLINKLKEIYGLDDDEENEEDEGVHPRQSSFQSVPSLVVEARDMFGVIPPRDLTQN